MYKCLKCGKDVETERIKEKIRCPYCGYRIIVKETPKTIKGLEIFRKTAEALPDLRFYWAGGSVPSVFTAERKKLLKTLDNVPSNLKFLGFVNDITEMHCGGDVFLFPSFTENQGIAVLEALACGKPVVMRDLPSYDWAIDNYNCLIAKTDKEFINRVERISENKRLRDSLSRNAIKTAKKHDIKIVIKQLINIYEDILDNKKTDKGLP